MRLKWLAGGAVAIALLGTACSSSDDVTSTVTPTAAQEASATATATGTPGGMPGEIVNTATTGAADLRAGLTQLLQEHVYLAATATHAAINGGDFEGAAGALDANTVALSEAIGSVYGDDAAGAFLELWRTHIGFFVEYTQARAAGNDAAAEEAAAALDGYREDFAAFISSANPNLPKEAVGRGAHPARSEPVRRHRRAGHRRSGAVDAVA